MVGCVSRRHVAQLARQQLRVELPPDLIMLDEPISDFGEFKVGLNPPQRSVVKHGAPRQAACMRGRSARMRLHTRGVAQQGLPPKCMRTPMRCRCR